MTIYDGFAQVYDLFMDNIPYRRWSEYLIDILKKYQVDEGIVLELGCGTGNVTEYLADAGYDMIGIDNSEEMLEIALEKKNRYESENQGKERKILYLHQDMRELELYGTVSAVVSICDSLNYIMSEDELLQVFQLVNNYLDKKGLFIFDLNTEYKYKEILGDNTIAENREEGSFIWENYYYEEEGVNEYALSIYIKEKPDMPDDNRYRRYEEIHHQKSYSLNTVMDLLKRAGMEFITAYDAFSFGPPTNTSERIYIIAREDTQESKTYI